MTKKRQKTLKPIKESRAYAAAYRKLLIGYVKKLNLMIGKTLFGLLSKLDDKNSKKDIVVLNVKNDFVQYTTNDDELLAAFEGMLGKADSMLEELNPLVSSLLYQMKERDKKKFYKTLDDKFGVSLGGILEKENIRSSFLMGVDQNLSLIKSLTDKQLSRVKNVVLSDLRTGNFSAGTIRDTIRHDFGISSRHAKLIARDQSKKMTTTLNHLRFENLGVTKYIWRTSDDERVRGNPSGKYPNARPSHYAREGVEYSFKNPPKDGNPGEPINCRCYAEPIIDDDLLYSE